MFLWSTELPRNKDRIFCPNRRFFVNSNIKTVELSGTLVSQSSHGIFGVIRFKIAVIKGWVMKKRVGERKKEGQQTFGRISGKFQPISNRSASQFLLNDGFPRGGGRFRQFDHLGGMKHGKSLVSREGSAPHSRNPRCSRNSGAGMSKRSEAILKQGVTSAHFCSCPGLSHSLLVLVWSNDKGEREEKSAGSARQGSSVTPMCSRDWVCYLQANSSSSPSALPSVRCIGDASSVLVRCEYRARR